ncbi:MAG: DNA-binding response regulator [Cytophagia bacterium]|nr:DNA-binding response regulator [Cytophagia bacterium]NBW35070.1 DNA-binding response regulator [Cytophagia bacterium]
MKIRVVAIDDEPLALALIEDHIKKIPYLELIGSFYNPMDALDLIRQQSVDLLFLDINMPDIIGVDFVKGLTNPPKVIFITAYDYYAVQGFEVNAVDYLLKPVSFSRFLSSVERLKTNDTIKPKKEDFIFVKSEHNILKVDLKSIEYIEGYKDYLKIYTDQPKPILTITTFKAIEQLLPDDFLRIHKSYIVSINKIISFRNGKVLVKGKQLPIGDSYKEIFNKVVVEGRST